MSEVIDIPHIELTTGWIRGERIAGDRPPLQVFRGIPYAAPPTGERRWQPPRAPAPWSGTRDCTRFGAAPVQAAAPGAAGHVGDLDCLTLNIWTPEGGDGPHPVMVWIPGGGFIRGGAADTLYDGEAMARQGIVFVSVNYRIGVDGFLHFDDAAPNRGLQDQLAALRWVRDHIAAFGGDPRRVTVAGVSAGAGSIAHLMGLAESAPLFHRAILQSPSLQSHYLDDAQRIREALAGVLGVAPIRQALAAVPLPALTCALASFLGNEDLKRRWGLRPRHYFPVRPVIDGHMLRAEPLQAIGARLDQGAPRRPVLLGCNAEEMRFYLVPGGEIDRVDEDRIQTFVQDIGWPAQIPDAYRACDPEPGPGDVLGRIQSDYYYRRPTRALEHLLRKAGCPTYPYEFAWRSPLHGGRMGAAHAMEIPFVLGNTRSPRAREFIGTAPPPALARDMHDRWARFVRGETMTDWADAGSRLRIFA